MNLSLNGKIAVVCGSTSGIGKATALILAQRGATIILVARNKNKLDQVRSELSTKYCQKHEIICADFNYPDRLVLIIEDFFRDPPNDPNIGRVYTGCGVGIEALGSPI